MAITIELQPQSFTPAFNQNAFSVVSNTSATIFEYLINVRTSGGTILSRHTLPKRSDNGRAFFDAKRTIQNKVSYDLANLVASTNNIYKANNVHFDYYIQFAEISGSSYDNVVSGSPTNSNTITALNMALPEMDTISSNYIQNYQVGGVSGEPLFLTSMRGGNIRVRENDKLELGMLNTSGSTGFTRLVVETYNSSGTLIGTYKINNSFVGSTTTSELMLSIQIDPSSLNEHTLSSGSQPVITSSVSTYKVYTESGTSVRTSEILTYEIDRNCYEYEPVRVFWLNQYGRIDALNFNFATDTIHEINRNYYNKSQGGYVGNDYVRTTYEQGQTTFYSNYVKKLLLRTDYLEDYESLWVRDLMLSSIAWIYEGGQFKTIKVNTNNYTDSNYKKNGYTIDEIEVEYSVDNFRQTL